MINRASPLQREVAAAAAAGLVGGLIFIVAMQERGLTAEVTGLGGLSVSAAGLSLHVLLSTLAGAAFGLFFRYQPHSYATTIISGVVYGLLLWIIGPLTLRPGALSRGRPRRWPKCGWHSAGARPARTP